MILPSVWHSYLNPQGNGTAGTADSRKRITVMDVPWIERGFQPELTAIAGRDWMTLSAPLLEGTSITHNDILKIVTVLNIMSQDTVDSCTHCICSLLSLPLCCIPLCWYRNNAYLQTHKRLAQKVAEMSRDWKEQGLQLNYHCHPCDIPTPWGNGALYYLTLTRTNTEFPQACFDDLPMRKMYLCGYCCGTSPIVPAKIFTNPNTCG